MGSIVQNGKFALCALALDKQLNNVDFPTFGNPTIPAFMIILFSKSGQSPPKFAIPLIKCANIELKKGSLNKNVEFLHSL
ncbi:hypothetical protein GENT5_18950 [Flavobacterium ammoniigenes]|uniref:Uncharacterized protein n=1 Tax=Flavobacterium ammoniigenes TaxID=1751095 RepID=A0ABN6L1Q0_9FLAO|nr:hypothetical protein GENT5_18950 [Flavobacterium ammoniigenes]